MGRHSALLAVVSLLVSGDAQQCRLNAKQPGQGRVTMQLRCADVQLRTLFLLLPQTAAWVFLPAPQVHGTCLGFETLAVIASRNHSILSDFDAENLPSPLFLTGALPSGGSAGCSEPQLACLRQPPVLQPPRTLCAGLLPGVFASPPPLLHPPSAFTNHAPPMLLCR
jgi:hypothetical protein